MPWYVYLLFSIQVATFAVIVLIRPKKAEEKAPEHHEDKIFQLYTQIEEMLDSFEVYVGEMHAGLEEKRQELIELNRQAQVVYMQAMATAANSNTSPAQTKTEPAPELPETPEPPATKTFASAPPPKKKASKPPKETPSRLTDMDKEALGRLATKPQKVRFLMSRGLSLDEVAKELDIGRGEVILIADLDKT